MTKWIAARRMGLLMGALCLVDAGGANRLWAAPVSTARATEQGAALPVVGVEDWAVYGTAYSYQHDAAVPGGGVVIVSPGTKPVEPWSSGATMPLPHGIVAGEPVSAVFWARAARDTRVTIGFQGSAPGYARFASRDVMLTPQWQQMTIEGIAPPDIAANPQSLSVPLGLAGVDVRLGPVAFQRGKADAAKAMRAFAAFRPAQVVEDVRIPSETGVMLAGTLHLPAMPARAPFPLVLLIQGHGPNGRGGFPEIIRHLTAQGIAALEYDKRGVGQSSGVYKEDIARLSADAAAAVAAMRRRPDIDGRRIALVGHSQGGVVAPAVAAADPGIAAVVTLAGSVGDGLPALRRALVNQMVAAGRPRDVATAAIDAVITLLQARIDGRDAATVANLRAAVVARFEAAGFPRPQAEGALAMIDTEEAQGANKLHSASDLRAIHCPVLAVFASKDPLVIAADEAAQARLALAGNPRGQVLVLDGLSHWFQEGAMTGGEEEIARLGPNAGSPRLVNLVVGWLAQTFAEARPQGGGALH